MSLVYLIAGLPELHRSTLPAVSRADFIARCRENLQGDDLRELELALLLEEVEAGVRIQTRMSFADPDVSPDDVVREICARAPATAGGAPLSELPAFLRRWRPLRVQLRRLWRYVGRRAHSHFLRRWAYVVVDLDETITALLCKRHGLDRDGFLVQMRGSFDTTARFVIDHYDEADAGMVRRFKWVPAVAAALDDPDYEAGERALNDLRWQMIDGLCRPEPFCIDTVLSWYLKLRILEREAMWTPEAGQAVLAGVMDAAARLFDAAIDEQSTDAAGIPRAARPKGAGRQSPQETA